MKYFVPFNKNGNVELSEKELKKMLSEAYREGYAEGKKDQVIENAPQFELAEKHGESKKKAEFSKDGKILAFRATIL